MADSMEFTTLGGRSSGSSRASNLTDIRNDNQPVGPDSLRASRASSASNANSADSGSGISSGNGGASDPGGNGQPHREPRSQVKIVVPADHSMVSLLGSGDELLHVIEREFDADIHVRGNEITATGNPAETALVTDLFDELIELLRKGADLTPDAVERAAAMLRAERGVRPADVLTVGILSARGRTIRPKTLNQKRYADAIDKHTIVFAIGPAGTGKTYLAMAKAVKALQAKEVNRIILTRPAVEAGERLGFLPGTLYEKIDPYLRPLYDALHDMIDPDSIPRLMAAGIIEIAPLAFMRGRTLNDSFIILDEAQNTSAEQMKMFLTRLGFGSQVVVTGDVTQVDLPPGQVSGLRIVQDILDGIEDIHFARLTSHDVVRHRLVGKIVDAYERYDAHERQLGNAGNTGRPTGRKKSQ
jgi:phosphate starvation-inducible protein PhoH and related proteins